MPGLRAASLAEPPLFWTAELRGGFEHVRDVGQELRDNLRVISREPLALELRLPPDWFGPQSMLLLRLVCQPEMAAKPLQGNNGYLHYSLPLAMTQLKKPITAAKTSPPLSSTTTFITIMPEHLHV